MQISHDVAAISRHLFLTDCVGKIVILKNLRLLAENYFDGLTYSLKNCR